MRYTQPQNGPIALERGYPLAGGLVAFMPLTGKTYQDALDKATWTPAVTATPVAYDAAPRGLGLRIKGATAAYVSRPLPAALSTSTTQPLTIRFRLYLHAATTTALMSWGSTQQDGAPRIYVRVNGSSQLNVYVSGYNYTQPLVVEREYIFTHAFDGVTHSTYLNGVLIGSFVKPWAGNTSTFYLGNGFDGLFAGSDFLLSDFALWNRALTPQEVASDAQNPWQVVKAAQRMLAIPTAGGATTTTLTPNAAALALTGFAPTVAQTVTLALSPAPAALALTGFAPTVTRTANLALSPNPATLTLTGYAPTVAQSANVTISPAPASLTLTGFAPTVTQSGTTTLTPAPALLNLTGFAPSVTQTSTRTLTPAPAILTLTGYAPSVTQGPAQVAGPTPAYGVSTVMRASVTNRTASLRDSYAIQGGTLHDSYSTSTILRATTTNRTAALDDAPLNLTASLQ